MDRTDKIKAVFSGAWGIFLSLFGALAIPVLLLVLCNVIDYVTGIVAAGFRSEKITSYKGLKGIAKKVCMWLLVVVGAIIDELLVVAGQSIGITMPFTFCIAIVVAIWLVCNELISILENLKDIGVPLPAFLVKLTHYLKSKTEQAGEFELPGEEEGEETWQQ